MKPFTESLRYDYPLTPDSVVIDAGAYHGNWSAEIARKYGCWIFAFEPVARFHAIAKETLKPFSKIVLLNAGIGGSTRKEIFGVQNDSTGAFATSPEREEVHILGIGEMFDEMGAIPGQISLAKLNIEGGEFETLETLIEQGLIQRFDALQVQFHAIDKHSPERREKIRMELRKTHHLEWDEPFVWESWAINK
jgi:FkbM family methyltransferase